MVYCSICDNEFPEERMKKVISKKGIVSVCPNCFRDDMPVFKKPEDYQFEGIYKRKSVYERLSNAAGLKNPEEHKERISEFGKNSGSLRDDSLRRIVNKNFEKRVKDFPKNEDLIDNFHWILMRARRSKKISQKQLAENIKEPESAVAMAERGFVPQGSDLFVKKLEQFLGVRISKRNFENAKAGIFEEDLEKQKLLEKFQISGELDEEMTRELTIEDLQELDGSKKKKKKWWQFGRDKSSEDNELEEGSDEFLDLSGDSPFRKD